MKPMSRQAKSRKKLKRKEGIKIIHKMIVAKQEQVKAAHLTAHGPEPERLKITGVKRWEDAVSIAMRKPKPARGWPKK